MEIIQAANGNNSSGRWGLTSAPDHFLLHADSEKCGKSKSKNM